MANLCTAIVNLSEDSVIIFKDQASAEQYVGNMAINASLDGNWVLDTHELVSFIRGEYEDLEYPDCYYITEIKDDVEENERILKEETERLRLEVLKTLTGHNTETVEDFLKTELEKRGYKVTKENKK